jgi:hypothetical protein
METKSHYRLSSTQTASIANNLVEILQNDVAITGEAKSFIGNWTLTGRDEKKILRTRPVLQHT